LNLKGLTGCDLLQCWDLHGDETACSIKQGIPWSTECRSTVPPN